jgi:hypothetical protein
MALSTVQTQRKAQKSHRFKARERGRRRAIDEHAVRLAADPSAPPLDLRAVDLATFSSKYADKAWMRSHDRAKARERYQDKLKRLFGGQSKQQLAEKLVDIERRLLDFDLKKSVSDDDREFARIKQRVEEQQRLEEQRRTDNAKEKDPTKHRPFQRRISNEEMAQEYIWPGGTVGGRRQNAFTLPQPIISYKDEFLLRYVASTPRTNRHSVVVGGMAKDRNYSYHRKLPAFFNPYISFSVQCLDMFRVDIDRTFLDVEQLIEFITALDLPFPVNLAAWIWDDENHGIHNPHLYFYLPEGNAVWGNQKHVRLLDRIIAAVTIALEPLGADAGGLANPFHGKNPVSPHCGYTVLDRRMFALSEFAQVLDLQADRVLTARAMNNAALAEAMDFAESNAFLSSTARITTLGAREVYRADPEIAKDYEGFMAQVVSVAMARIDEISEADYKTRQILEAQVRRSARWAVDTFDPAALKAAFHDRGAAQHLIQPEDDLPTRRKIGQRVGAQSKAKTSFDKVSAAAVEIRRVGPFPDLPELRKMLIEKSGLGRTCVNKHLVAACIRAAATLALTSTPAMSRQSKVKGVDPLPSLDTPRVAVLAIARRLSDLPVSWRKSLPDGIQRSILLRESRQAGRNTFEDCLPRVRAIGANIIDFLQSGNIRHFGRRRLIGAGVGQDEAA